MLLRRAHIRCSGTSIASASFTTSLPIFIDLQHLQRMGLLSDSFPLHHRTLRHSLQYRWGSFWLLLSFSQPIHEVCEYFGSEIGFYFLFLHELSVAIAILAVLTLVCTAWMYVRYGDSGYGHPGPVVSVITMIWYRIFTKHWLQTEGEYAAAWGLHAHRKSSVKQLRNDRFTGEMLPSQENEFVLQPQGSSSAKTCGRALSAMLTSSFVFVLFITVAWELYVFLQLSRVYTSPRDAKLLSAAVGTFCAISRLSIRFGTEQLLGLPTWSSEPLRLTSPHR